MYILEDIKRNPGYTGTKTTFEKKKEKNVVFNEKDKFQ